MNMPVKVILIMSILVSGAQSARAGIFDRRAGSTSSDSENISGHAEIYQEKYPPLMGKTENEIIEAKGAPDEIQKAGDYTIYIYHVTHGSRGLNLHNVKPGDSFESFDQARIYFKDGKSIKWDAKWQ